MSARFYRNADGTRLCGGLHCQTPGEGDQPFASSPFAHLVPQSRRRASRDLFSGSLAMRYPVLKSLEPHCDPLAWLQYAAPTRSLPSNNCCVFV
jgi:hypothetical protein